GAEIFFQPNVKADKQIAASHFLDLQFGDAAATISPGDRDGRPGEAANDRFQGELDREVEMRRDQRLAALDYVAAVSFEGVGRVVQPDPEHDLQEKIREPVQEQFELRIIDHAPSSDEAAAKDTVVAFVQLVPVANDVPAIVRFVGHHDDNRVAFHGGQAPDNGASKSMRPGILDRRQNRKPRLKLRKSRPGAVGASVVDDDDLVRNFIAA